MIAALIRAAIAHRVFVLLAALALALMGMFSVTRTPVDALPDLSDTQVIIRTSYPGQAPQVVEDQVTYPLATTMLSVPGATTVRAFSFFGDSYVNVLFDDRTDLYWARSRVLEYLSQARDRLPAGITNGEAQERYALLCQAYALVDLTVETREVRPAPEVEVRNLPCRIDSMERLADDGDFGLSRVGSERGSGK